MEIITLLSEIETSIMKVKRKFSKVIEIENKNGGKKRK